MQKRNAFFASEERGKPKMSALSPPRQHCAARSLLALGRPPSQAPPARPRPPWLKLLARGHRRGAPRQATAALGFHVEVAGKGFRAVRHHLRRPPSWPRPMPSARPQGCHPCRRVRLLAPEDGNARGGGLGAEPSGRPLEWEKSMCNVRSSLPCRSVASCAARRPHQCITS
jgi:hypothetical protein